MNAILFRQGFHGIRKKDPSRSERRMKWYGYELSILRSWSMNGERLWIYRKQLITPMLSANEQINVLSYNINKLCQ